MGNAWTASGCNAPFGPKPVNRLRILTPRWSAPLRPDRIGFDFDPQPGVVIFELRGAEIAERRVEPQMISRNGVRP